MKSTPPTMTPAMDSQQDLLFSLKASLQPASPSPSESEVEPAQPTTFHRRALPGTAVEFSSREGRRLFAEALADGTLGGFFRLIEQFHTQSEPAFCGLGTLSMALNAMNVDPGKTWKGPWRWYHEGMLDCCESLEVVKSKGITWSSFICLARCNGLYAESHRVDEPGSGLADFRRLVEEVMSQSTGCAAEEEVDGFQVLVVAYSRKQFLQTGDGHYSPIGGYHRGSDKILVLDVARFKHPPHWVSLADMHEAMRHIDPDTGRCRGFIKLTKRRALAGGWLSLTIRPPFKCGSGCIERGGACGDGAAPELVSLPAAFRAALCDDLPGQDHSPRRLAAAALRRAARFCESDAMPLSIACHDAFLGAAAADGRVAQDMPTSDVRRATTERARCMATVKCLDDVASAIDAALPGTGIGDVAPKRRRTNFCVAPRARDATSEQPHGCRILHGGRRRTALLLALEPSLWSRALSCLGEVGDAAWGVLQPLLHTESLPSPLKEQVLTLREQCADLLSRSSGDVDCQQHECGSSFCASPNLPKTGSG